MQTTFYFSLKPKPLFFIKYSEFNNPFLDKIGEAHAIAFPNKEISMKNLLKNQKGQGVMEYVIISSLVGIVCIAAVKGFGGVIKKRIEYMENSIVHNIEKQN